MVKLAHFVVAKQPESGCLIMLVVADEAVVRPNLKKILTSSGFDVRPATLAESLHKLRDSMIERFDLRARVHNPHSSVIFLL